MTTRTRRSSLRRLPIALLGVLGLLLSTLGGSRASAQEDAVLGQIVIGTQGVAAVPAGDVVWRTVRDQAEPTGQAQFAPRPLSFVIATTEPILLADDTLTHLSLIYQGEAAFVAPGMQQQRSSLSDAPANYLAIELVSAADALVSDGSTVLQPGQPFPSPGGFRDFDLVMGTLTEIDAYTVPDTGQKNIILITAGAVNVGKPGSAPTTLIAGESATFSGELDVTGTTPDGSSFVVAVMGDEVVPPPVQAATQPTPAANQTPILQAPETTTPTTAEGAGSISVQAFICPPGMTPETLDPNQCELTGADFAATLAGTALPAPMILADAAAENGTYTWSSLPFGEYRIAQTVLPAGYDSYLLSGTDATGDATTGYFVTLSPENPNLQIQFVNFAPE